MVTLRVAKVTVQTDHKLRVAKVTAQGTSTNPKLRVANVVAQFAGTLHIAAIPDQTVEAYATTPIAVPGLSTFPLGTSFVWRQISGPATTFADNGSSITFVAPIAMAGATVVFGVTAQNGPQSSTEATATVNVIPHLYWTASVDGAWVPQTRKARA